MFTQLLSDAQSAWFNTEAMKFLLSLIYVFYGISNERERRFIEEQRRKLHLLQTFFFSQGCLSPVK